MTVTRYAKYIMPLLVALFSLTAQGTGGTDAGVPGDQSYPVRWNLSSNGSYSNSHDSASAACTVNPALNHSGETYWLAGLGSNWGCKGNQGGGSFLYAICHSPAHNRYPGYPGTPTGPTTHCVQPNACPVGSTLANGKCTCNAGLFFDGTACKAPVCTAGQAAGTVFLGMGKSAGPGKPWQVDQQMVSQSVASACAGGCALKLTPQSAQNGSCYAAPGDPVGGTVSCAVTGMEETGSLCATSGGDNTTPPASSKPDNSKPATTCATGQQAYVVNGVTKCYTPSGDSVPSTADNKNMVTTNQVTTNPDGSKTVVTTTVNQATGQSSTTTVTYPAGSTIPDGLPSTSTSPVIPGMGTGGTSGAGGTGAGVPSGSGSGGNGTGDAHCGAAGQPPCKMDETGTPTDGDLSEQHTAFDQASQARETSISDIAGTQRVTELPWVWSPSFPTGSCQNLDFNIPGGKGATIDMCSSGHLQSARQLWGWLLYMLFAVYAWKRFTGSVERD